MAHTGKDRPAHKTVAPADTLPFIVCSASAGSGKTYTLVKEYLKLVIANPGKHNNILAITFTNKAAGEMKERIVARLKAMAAGKDPDLLKAIAAETGIPAATVRARVPAVLSTILHKYSDFAVMTIDSFIYRVVRSFAVELNLPLNAQVELNIPAITRTAVDSLIALCGKDVQVQQFLVDFVLRRLDEGGSWNIEGDLQKFAQELFREKSHEHLHTLAGVDFTAAVADLAAQRGTAMAALKSIAQEAQLFYEAHGHLFKDKSRSGPATMAKFADADDAKRIATLLEQLAGKDFAPGKSADTSFAAAFTGAHELRDRLLAAAQTYLTLAHIDQFIYAMALLGKLTALVDAYCREAAVVPIADFNRLVATIIRDEFIPFIYWRVGEKYEHYLIDEFQDTSQLQWHNLLPLIDNALATGRRNLVVGDPKQAIYRWRSGDATIMVEGIPQHFANRQQNEQLATNRRSLPAVIRFNNAFFAAAAQACADAPPLLREIYRAEAVTQQSHRTGDGYIELQLLPRTGGEPLRWLVENIKSILAGDSGYTAGDIAVLVRTRDHGVQVADALFAANIPVLSSEALLLGAQPVVVFLVNALRHLVTSSYIELAALILFHRTRSRDTATVAAELAAARAEGSAALLQLLPEDYADRQGQLRRRPLYEVAEELIRIFDLAAAPGDHAALQGFLDVVHTYATREGSDIARFLEWWEAKNEDAPPALQAPAGSDAVTVLTIHKAKGLEFPVVCIPFAGWELEAKTGTTGSAEWLAAADGAPAVAGLAAPYLVQPKKYSTPHSHFAAAFAAENQQALLDNLNLLYVAFTRAGERLYVAAPVLNKENAVPERLEMKSAGELIAAACPLLADAGILTESEPHRWVSGTPQPRSGAKKSVAAATALEFISGQWRNRLLIRRRAGNLWRLDDPQAAAAVERGTLLHTLLDLLRGNDTAAVAAAVEAAVRRGLLPAAERETWQQHLQQALTLTDGSVTLCDWFAPGITVLHERPLLTATETLRPDRVVISGNTATVIDYKTGMPDAAKRKAYYKQIREYGALLAQMGHTVKLYLAWLDASELEEVSA